MDRKAYQPSFAVVYLDESSLEFLTRNPEPNLWNEFVNRLHSVFPELSVHINISKDLKQKIVTFISEKTFIFYEDIKTDIDLLSKIAPHLPPSQFNDPDWDEVCFLYFTGISPLLNTQLTKKSWERHKNFFCQYSYSENLPPGLIPSILTREFLSSLPENLSTDVHSFFLKNINVYDVDIFFQSPDLRQFRLDFRLKEERSLTLINGILQKNPNLSYEQLLPFLKENPSLLRPSPSYIEWEIFHGCELNCTFCPRTKANLEKDGSYINFEESKQFLNSIQTTWKSPITIAFGGNGEPLLHPNFSEITKSVLKLENLSELIIETALYRNVNEFLEFLSSLNDSEKNKICVIVNFSTLKEDTYQKLYGGNNFESTKVSIEKLSKILPPKSLNVQMIKMLDVESEIDSYFTYFEKKGINVILQKFNTFAHKLPERRVSDLTPIHRDFCWHLSRDLYINVDGTVAICKQDTKKLIGNIHEDKLEEIWNQGLIHFQNSLLGNHEAIPAPCLHCDEWYTFNA